MRLSKCIRSAVFKCPRITLQCVSGIAQRVTGSISKDEAVVIGGRCSCRAGRRGGGHGLHSGAATRVIYFPFAPVQGDDARGTFTMASDPISTQGLKPSSGSEVAHSPLVWRARGSFDRSDAFAGSAPRPLSEERDSPVSAVVASDRSAVASLEYVAPAVQRIIFDYRIKDAHAARRSFVVIGAERSMAPLGRERDM